MLQNLLIWGASGHARVVADIARLRGYQIVGFLDDIHLDRHQTEFAGASIIGGREQLDIMLAQGNNQIVLAIGDCQVRLRLADYARQKGFTLATLIHPSAVVAADAVIGEGTVIAAHAVINPACVIGANVIINTSASVDHESYLAAGVHISPGAHLAGNVHVGFATWLGIGVVVKEEIQIGSKTVVGAGSVVIHDLPDNVVAYGVPARIMKQRENDDHVQNE